MRKTDDALMDALIERVISLEDSGKSCDVAEILMSPSDLSEMQDIAILLKVRRQGKPTAGDSARRGRR